MELKQNSIVKSATGETVGRVSHFVIDPRTNEISHLIVEKGFLFMEDRVVPMQAVAHSSGDEITLAPGKGEPEDFPLFDQSYYVKPGEYSTEPDTFPSLSTYYYYPPVTVAGGVPATAMAGGPRLDATIAEATEELPDNSVALRKGADVYSSDGHLVGQIDQVVTAPDSSRVSHVIMSQGLLMKTYKLLPIHWLGEMSSERVDLGTSKTVIDDLPDYTP